MTWYWADWSDIEYYQWWNGIIEDYSGISYLDRDGIDEGYECHFEIRAKLLSWDIEEFKKVFPDLGNSKIDMQSFKGWIRPYVPKYAESIASWKQ